VYARRHSERGLLGTLRDALGAGPDANIVACWRAREQESDKPLIVVLDQVEEAFTRPIATPRSSDDAVALTPPIDPKAELNALAEAVRGLGLAIGRPHGKLVLGFRKEWLQEIEQALAEVASSEGFVNKVPLDAMGCNDIREAVGGPASDPALSGLRLEVDDELPGLIAHDLLSDPDARAVIAPTLQVILSQLWDQVKDSSPRRYTVDLYNTLKGEGLLLRAFLDKQLKRFRGIDIRLMPPLNDVSGIPRNGNYLVIVAAVGQLLRFRVFDSDGKMVLDKDEEGLTDKARQIGDLKKHLASFWPPTSLTASRRIASSAPLQQSSVTPN
jgi:hypothetical protein